uniref:Carboxypeptidase n=1 Tax=Steinernema glaseri TaxID=37863 RepID=A0A1I8A947_9BILA
MRSSVLVALCLCLGLVLAAEIKQLPGAPNVPWKQYAGYFDVGENKGHHLHYWFVESQNDPVNDPVLLWLTGGPGCSGFSAVVTEWGPFRVQPDGKTLDLNPHSWNKIANVLTLEAPAGVGFSYTDDGDVSTNDQQTAEENWEALRAFFEQFPQFKSNDFYVTGESYGGVYVPTLVDTILRKQSDYQMNLKGFAIGNGCVSGSMGTDTIIQFTYNHGMVDEDVWQKTKKQCCNGAIDGCPFHTFGGFGYCASFAQETAQAAWYSGINPYNMYEDCAGGDGQSVKPIQTRYAADYYHKTGRKLPANFQSVMCLDETPAITYFNIPAVRKAFLVPDSLGQWSLCSDDVVQTYQRGPMEMGDIIKNALNKGIRGMLYNGDVDMACNFLMGQRFSANLGRAQVSAKQEFQVNGQVGGFYTAYDAFEFYTVRGAGHMVPQDKPAVAFHVISSFLNKQTP